MRNTSGPGGRGEKVTGDFSAPGRAGVSEDRNEQPEWLVRERLKQIRRRHSVTLGDKAQIMRRQHYRTDSTCSLKVQFSKHLPVSEIKKVKCVKLEPICIWKDVLNLDYGSDIIHFSHFPNESTFPKLMLLTSRCHCCVTLQHLLV